MPTILVVDDRDLNRKFLASLLGYVGYEVIEAVDGAEALVMAQNKHPDLIISDILMPTMDGVELVKKLKEDPVLSAITVIFYTATYRLQEARTMANTCGVTRVIPKPSEPDEILRIVGECLGKEISVHPISAADAADFKPAQLGLVGEKLAQYLADLQKLVKHIADIVGHGLEVVSDSGELKEASRRLERSFLTLQGVGLRLAALIELGLTIASVREPEQLLELFCRALQDILGAKYAGIGVTEFGKRKPWQIALYGVEKEEVVSLKGELESSLTWLMSEKEGRRVRIPDGDPASAGLPLSHPLFHSFLGMPVKSPSGVVGWLYVAEKLGAEEFSTEDEQLVGTLSAQLAMTYENLVLYDEIQDHAARLQTEMLRREDVERELRKSERRYRLLAEHASDMISVHDRKGRFTYVSPSCRTLIGYEPEALVGRRGFDLVHPEDRTEISRVLTAILSGSGLQTIQCRLQHRDRHDVWVEAIGQMLPKEDQEGMGEVLVISRDITERMKIEAAFRQSQKIEAMGQLAGGVAHDFNNLLTVICGHVELLEEEQLDEHVKVALAEIGGAAKRAGNLTSQLLLFGRRQTMQFRSVNLEDTISDLTKLLHRVIGEDITLQFKYKTNIPLVYADAGMIDQAVMNLAVNSRDAMPEGGMLLIALEVLFISSNDVNRHPSGYPGEFVIIKVIDTGSGISSDILPRIFEPFMTTKPVGKGTGLGLSTVLGIVQQHHGWIEVESEVGHGTNFSIYLPARRDLESSDTAGVAAPIPTGNETILLVEDEPGVCWLCCAFLERCGYRVLLASSGKAALQVWEEHRDEIKLLLTDAVMPEGVSGPELARRLRLTNPLLKVIITSGYSPEVAVVIESQAVGVRFLQKPFSMGELVRMIRTLLDE